MTEPKFVARRQTPISGYLVPTDELKRTVQLVRAQLRRTGRSFRFDCTVAKRDVVVAYRLVDTKTADCTNDEAAFFDPIVVRRRCKPIPDTGGYFVTQRGELCHQDADSERLVMWDNLYYDEPECGFDTLRAMLHKV